MDIRELLVIPVTVAPQDTLVIVARLDTLVIVEQLDIQDTQAIVDKRV